jgi:hypothetical protein
MFGSPGFGLLFLSLIKALLGGYTIGSSSRSASLEFGDRLPG